MPQNMNRWTVNLSEAALLFRVGGLCTVCYIGGSGFHCGSPVTQCASLGLNNAEVPQGQVPAWISLPVAKHLNSQRSLR